MQNITIELTEEKIRESFKLAVDKILKDDYGNPVKKAIEEAISSKQGEVKKVVDEIITNAISDPSFKSRIADAVISRMVESAIRK